MVKRAIEHFNDTALPRSPAYQTSGCKRRQASKFLQRDAHVSTILKTCQFFESEFTILASKEEPSVLKGGEKKPKNLSALTIRSSLRREMFSFEAKHESHCTRLQNDADSAIQLKESFRCISDVMMPRDTNASSVSSAPIDMLELGPETAQSLSENIASFAGVPSDCDADDWVKLSSLLQQRSA